MIFFAVVMSSFALMIRVLDGNLHVFTVIAFYMEIAQSITVIG